ncbi:hypothetical protein COV18_00575 [Candidatus Woesearchaeota archaeon CG10_big_fil_rev_8_21_14_0_10_37_12]|nr:MAG: hypothetical protein COV18_00575 [Candidatus Woesearchaeota archaeon CG10_big_fil_rev_8_21_14_0_10_37_12]
MFVRVKNINGKPYAYLVENEWTPWGSRQKVTKYLGRMYAVERFKNYIISLPQQFKQSIIEIIRQEVLNHGFTADMSFHPANTLYKKDDLTLNLETLAVRKRKKDVVLGMNEGYLCEYTIKDLLNYAPNEDESPEKNAKKLANLVLEAGLKLTDGQFVWLFNSI